LEKLCCCNQTAPILAPHVALQTLLWTLRGWTNDENEKTLGT
jgi:hypothetical protein